MTPEFDSNGYPTDETIRAIEQWEPRDFDGLFAFIEAAWNDCGSVISIGDQVSLVTGGWSGNEEIVDALGRNRIADMLYWESSHRGGLHVYKNRIREAAE